ncbi:MAG: type II toxin-antitoxin system RelE/ParE family toxin [Thermomicrobiales bacterium]|nr:type II toxin-antitoxin system RelE/ParE family toxin [Thermomicrobiales bacterium]
MKPTRKLTLASVAARDIRLALRATRHLWGDEQRIQYERQLHATMSRLLEFPDMGIETSEFGSGIRAVMCSQHRIYYRADSEVVHILRVLHVRMDAASAFRTQRHDVKGGTSRKDAQDSD